MDKEFTFAHPVDREIAFRITEILQRAAPEQDVKFLVRDGSVLFTGDVSNFRIVDDVLARTNTLSGVEQVRSNMTIDGRDYMRAWQ